MFTVSPYKLNMYLECPRHYWWNYINPSTRSLPLTRPYFTLGDHVHNTLKLFFNLPIDQRSKAVLLSLFAAQWLKKSGLAGGFRTPEQEQYYKERGQLMLSAFCDREDITIKPLWASDKMITTGVSENLSLGGKIDRVDETPAGLHVIDYKTSKEEREDQWQLPIYAVMAKRYWQKPVAKLSYHFLETGNWVTVSANPTRDGWTIGRIQQIVDGMPHSTVQETWVCPDGLDCQHCDYLKEFGLDPHGKNVQLPSLTFTTGSNN